MFEWELSEDHKLPWGGSSLEYTKILPDSFATKEPETSHQALGCDYLAESRALQGAVWAQPCCPDLPDSLGMTSVLNALSFSCGSSYQPPQSIHEGTRQVVSLHLSEKGVLSREGEVGSPQLQVPNTALGS